MVVADGRRPLTWLAFAAAGSSLAVWLGTGTGMDAGLDVAGLLAAAGAAFACHRAARHAEQTRSNLVPPGGRLPGLVRRHADRRRTRRVAAVAPRPRCLPLRDRRCRRSVHCSSGDDARTSARRHSPDSWPVSRPSPSGSSSWFARSSTDAAATVRARRPPGRSRSPDCRRRTGPTDRPRPRASASRDAAPRPPDPPGAAASLPPRRRRSPVAAPMARRAGWPISPPSAG